MKILILLVSSAVAFIMLMASLAPADSAPADASFAVNDQSDAVDNNIGDGVCLAANGKCTLRAAIQEANAQFAAHPTAMYTITVPGALTLFSPPRLYALTLTGSGEDNATTGDLDIKSNLFIRTSNGQPALVSAAAIGDRVFHVIQPPGRTISVTFASIWMANGSVADRGGGLLVDSAASVTLSSARVMTNSVSGQFAEGGGIDLRGGGTLTLNSVLVRANRVQGGNNGGTRG